MTYGLFLTLATAVTGLFTALFNWRQLRALPTRTEPGYDETVKARALGHKIAMAVGLALPFMAYAAFSLADPVLFGMEMF